jgi:hypothetical protein
MRPRLARSAGVDSSRNPPSSLPKEWLWEEWICLLTTSVFAAGLMVCALLVIWTQRWLRLE